jgi:hypothetical protein
MFPIKNGKKQGDILSPLLYNSVLEYVIEDSDIAGWLEIKWYTPASGLH